MAGALAGTLAGVRQVYRGAVPPHDGRTTVPGLDGAVEIVRDSDGIPHVRATTECDALAGLGYCHAQDRLWQMEMIRRIIRGTLAELVGKEAIETDRYARTLGLGGIADAEADGLSEDDRVAVDAYCRGVNAYLGGPSFRLPLELRLLVHRRVGPWTAGDALLGMRVFALTLSQNWEGEIVRSRLAAKLGAERLEQLEPGYPGDGYTTLPAAPQTRCGPRSSCAPAPVARRGPARTTGCSRPIAPRPGPRCSRTTRTCVSPRPAPGTRRTSPGTASAPPV